MMFHACFWSRLQTLCPLLKLSAVMATLLAMVSPSVRAGQPFPYDTKTGTEIGMVTAAAACYGLGWWLDRDFRVLIPEEVDALDAATLNFFDRGATGNWSPRADRVSDFLITGQITAGAGLGFVGAGARQPLKVTLIYAETMALSSGLTYLLKNAFTRSRPFVYNHDPAIAGDLKTSPTARRSFPSGHTANAFAAMVFLAGAFDRLNPEDGHSGLVWGACLGSAAVTGALRVASGRHFASDVVAGAVLGSLVGWAVPSLHEIDGSPRGVSKSAVSLSWGFGF